MIYKSLNKDFYYVDSGSTRLSYYLTCGDETIYTGRAYNPNGIKINLRKIIEDWLWNDMPDFRNYDGVIVTHEDAYKIFTLFNDEGTQLEEYKVLLAYEDWQGEDEALTEQINGNVDPRQKIFWASFNTTERDITIEIVRNLELYFDVDMPFWVPESGGTFNIHYTANTEFTFSYTGDWFTAVLSGDTIVITATENETDDNRSGYICFTYLGTDFNEHTKCYELLQEPVVDVFKDKYLTFEIISGGTIVWDGGASFYSGDNLIHLTFPIEYSKNSGGTWTQMSSGSWSGSGSSARFVSGTTISVLAGEEIMFRGNNLDGTSITDINGDPIGGASFSGSTAVFNVNGNILSLLYGEDFVNHTELPPSRYSYGGVAAIQRTFRSTNVVSAKNLILLPENLGRGTYMYMFKNCSRLVDIPRFGRGGGLKPGVVSLQETFANCTSLKNLYGRSLVVSQTDSFSLVGTFTNCTSLVDASFVKISGITTLAGSDFTNMFSGCTSLTVPPVLPLAEPAVQSYWGMFAGCSSLVNAPDMLWTRIEDAACYGMYSGCTSLSYIKCTAEYIETDQHGWLSTHFWVRGVSASGTFVKSANMNDWSIGNDGIPVGWTVIDAV